MDKTEDRMIKILQRKFGYNDEEAAIFKSNPQNLELISRSKEFKKTKFILAYFQQYDF